jgi:hypothetical protein
MKSLVLRVLLFGLCIAPAAFAQELKSLDTRIPAPPTYQQAHKDAVEDVRQTRAEIKDGEKDLRENQKLLQSLVESDRYLSKMKSAPIPGDYERQIDEKLAANAKKREEARREVARLTDEIVQLKAEYVITVSTNNLLVDAIAETYEAATRGRKPTGESQACKNSASNGAKAGSPAGILDAANPTLGAHGAL